MFKTSYLTFVEVVNEHLAASIKTIRDMKMAVYKPDQAGDCLVFNVGEQYAIKFEVAYNGNVDLSKVIFHVSCANVSETLSSVESRHESDIQKKFEVVMPFCLRKEDNYSIIISIKYYEKSMIQNTTGSSKEVEKERQNVLKIQARKPLLVTCEPQLQNQVLKFPLYYLITIKNTSSKLVSFGPLEFDSKLYKAELMPMALATSIYSNEVENVLLRVVPVDRSRVHKEIGVIRYRYGKLGEESKIIEAGFTHVSVGRLICRRTILEEDGRTFKRKKQTLMIRNKEPTLIAVSFQVFNELDNDKVFRLSLKEAEESSIAKIISLKQESIEPGKDVQLVVLGLRSGVGKLEGLELSLGGEVLSYENEVFLNVSTDTTFNTLTALTQQI